MPQLSSGGGDDLGANDEMISFKDEGEQEEKIQENAFTERDLADLKRSDGDSRASSGASQRNTGSTLTAVRTKKDSNSQSTLTSPSVVSKQQDGGMYKTPAYPGYPFLMLPDPYLPNSSVSPSQVTLYE
ncbi:hypothetical protein INR49_005959 [Caranx melampygus]|nr:hypothetical protein INR49_005959 [Caranx melampygus]